MCGGKFDLWQLLLNVDGRAGLKCKNGQQHRASRLGSVRAVGNYVSVGAWTRPSRAGNNKLCALLERLTAQPAKIPAPPASAGFERFDWSAVIHSAARKALGSGAALAAE